MRNRPFCSFIFFFFNDTATTEIYTLSLHDALPIFASDCDCASRSSVRVFAWIVLSTMPIDSTRSRQTPARKTCRSEEHTSELQSPCNLVCRLLLEKKKKTDATIHYCKTLYVHVRAV